MHRLACMTDVQSSCFLVHLSHTVAFFLVCRRLLSTFAKPWRHGLLAGSGSSTCWKQRCHIHFSTHSATVHSF